VRGPDQAKGQVSGRFSPHGCAHVRYSVTHTHVCTYVCTGGMMPKTRSHGDGALYEIRGGTLWRGVVDGGIDESGQRIQWSVSARTKTEAARRLNALRAEVSEHGAPLGKSVTVAQWAPTWLDTVARPDVDPKTYADYASSVRRWIVPVLGTKRLATLTPSDVRTLRKRMTDAGRATSTVRGVHVALCLMLDAAKADRLCRTNVARDVRPPSTRKDVTRTDRGALATQQVASILAASAALPDASGARWWFRVLTGARQGEILGAQIADLDLDAGLYVVSWKLEELRREHGCGDERCRYTQAARCPRARWVVPDGFEREHIVGAWHLTRPKSRTGRAVPLVPQLVEALRRWLTATADWPNPHGLIFRRPDGSPILPRDDAQEWRDLLAAAGVITADQTRPGGTELTGHWTRHTVVTILASLGVDFQIIGEIVGHSSTQVTAMYRHAQDVEKRAAMTALAGAWADGLAPRIAP